MPKAEKMKCLDCGVDMNHHAEKIDYSADFVEPDAIDIGFGGALTEIHTCPGCGKTAERLS